MNKLKLFPIALTALVLGACSSEDIIDNGGQGTVLPGEKGYVSFSFNLPTTPSSRANDQFDDGNEKEYYVKDATLLLFAGTNEANSTFAGAYNLTLPTADKIEQDFNVTTRYTLVQKIEEPGSGKIYAMVILNGKNNVISQKGTTWQLNGQDLTATTSFSSLYTTAKSFDVSKIADTTGDGYFLMTNAPMFTAPGGTNDPTNPAPGGEVKTLAEIDRNRIYHTEAEAKAKPATEIYCERAVAKVTVNGDKGGSVSGNNKVTNYELQGWTLDITSKQAYLVRNVIDPNNINGWWGYVADNKTDHRFVGSVGLTNTADETYYRTYWAQDPTYSDNTASDVPVDNNKFYTTIGTAPTTVTGIGEAAYCLENTFDVANQNQNQTTRAIVAAKLSLQNGADGETDGSFLILNDNKDVIYSIDDVKTTLANAFMNSPAISEILENSLKDKNTSLSSDNFVVSFGDDETNAKAGYWTVESITLKDGYNDYFKDQKIPDALTNAQNATAKEVVDAVNQDYKVAYYKAGVAYYPVRIRHFDDEQTPWSETGKTDNAYPEPSEKNYLGRYGVVRNNWYDITVTGIKNIGSSVPDEVYGQDDPLDKWISVRINVLSWAKRTQNVEL